MYEYEIEVTYQYTDRVTANTKGEALNLVRTRLRTDDIKTSDFNFAVVDVAKVSEVDK
jgi:hypothetical protein